jgi:prepilin peptidase CpaA
LNLIAAAPLWLLGVLACALVAAAVEDGARYRISNITSMVVLAGAIIAAIVADPSWALWQNVAVFLAVLVLGTIAFSSGWLGGGDVKFFAATALWFDLESALQFVLLVFLAGGVVAIGYLLSRTFRKREAGKKRKGKVPYGIAIGVGGIAMILIHSGLFHHRESPPAFKVVQVS